MAGRLFLLLLIVSTAAGVYAVREGVVAIPDSWNPWAPLRIEEPLHWLTRHKQPYSSHKGIAVIPDARRQLTAMLCMVSTCQPCTAHEVRIPMSGHGHVR